MKNQFSLSNNNSKIWIMEQHRNIPSILKQWKDVRSLIHIKQCSFSISQWNLFLSHLDKLFSIQGIILHKNVCIGLQIHPTNRHKMLIKESCQQILESLGYSFHNIKVICMNHKIDFLGYDLKCYRQAKSNIQVNISNQYLNWFCHEHCLGMWHKLKATPCSFMLNRSDKTIIAWFHDIFMNLMRHYDKDIIRHNKTWKQFHYIWKLSLLHSLAKKHKSSIKQIEHRFKHHLIAPRLCCNMNNFEKQSFGEPYECKHSRTVRQEDKLVSYLT